MGIEIANKKSLQKFKKNLPMFPFKILTKLIGDWERLRNQIAGSAANKTPLLTGDLQRSVLADSISVKTKITSNGLESVIQSKLPYAKKVHGDPETGEIFVNLREEGTTQKVNGTEVTKSRKGVYFFINVAIKEKEKQMFNIVKEAIREAFTNV